MPSILDIHIEDELADVTIQSEEGVVTQNKILTRDLKSIFQEEERSYESPWLPGEYGTHLIHQSGRTKTLIYSEPAREVTIPYEMETYGMSDLIKSHWLHPDVEWGIGNVRLKSVAPTLVWGIRFQERSEGLVPVAIRMYTARGPLLSKDTPLYQPPFSNIYDGYDVCWGEDGNISLPSEHAIQGLSSRFFNSWFNSDLGDEFVRNVEYNGQYISNPVGLHLGLDRMYRDGESFESRLHLLYDKMKPSRRREKTVGELFDSMKG